VHGSKITLVHAVFFDSEEFAISPEQNDKRLSNAKVMCEKAVKECASGTLDIEYLVVQGEPHEVIPNIARERECDLIAMGTYGRKGIKRMIMGSVTAGVLLDAPCDVLVVKRPCEECTGEYHSILVPYDGSELGKLAIERVAAIMNSTGATVTIIYVAPRYEEMIGFFRSQHVKKQLGEETRKIILSGEELASKLGMKVNTIVEEGRPSDEIIETSQGLKSDLIVMGSHGWRGIDKSILGSTTERVIAHAKIPVLVVRQATR
jgi:nucleotide-binding universal stress UspA family protein